MQAPQPSEMTREMDKLIIGIGHEIDEVPSDFDGEVPDDFAASLLSLSTKLSSFIGPVTGW